MKKAVLCAAILASLIAVSSSVKAEVLYSADEYPTAQGKYLNPPASAKETPQPAVVSHVVTQKAQPGEFDSSENKPTTPIQAEPVLPSQQLPGVSH